MKITNDAYFAIPAINNSGLTALDKSPAYYRWWLANKPDSASMAFGRATHAALLEPDKFSTEYAVAPKVDKRTKEGKAAWAEFEASNASRTILTQEEGDKIGGIIQAVHGHSTANRILASLDAIEESFVWDEDPAGSIPVQGKARLDGYSLKVSSIVDIKTTRDANSGAFTRSILSYGYHRQAAWYLRAAASAGLEVDSFIFLAVESEPPHGVAVYVLDAPAIAQGVAEINRLLGIYRRCVETDTWPGYPDEIQTINLPKYGFKDVPFEGEPKF